MKSTRRSLLLAASALALATHAAPAAAQHAGHTVVTTDTIQWKPAPPVMAAGSQIAVLYGNPQKDGPFVMRIKIPANAKIPPHRHPKDELFTVISGRVAMGFGDKFDASTTQKLAAGSFIALPVGHAHYFSTDQETVIQLNAIGPFGIEFVNPDDDPRKKH